VAWLHILAIGRFDEVRHILQVPDSKVTAAMKVEFALAHLVKMWCAKHGMILAKYPADACQLVSALLATRRIEGDIADVGTGAGGSARLMSEYCGGKTIHLFDTFEGLPTPGILDERFREGSYRCSIEEVQRYLQGHRLNSIREYFPVPPTPYKVIGSHLFTWMLIFARARSMA
jgi:hypothetical protein